MTQQYKLKKGDKVFLMWEKQDHENFKEFIKNICGIEIDNQMENLQRTHYMRGFRKLRDIHVKVILTSKYKVKVGVNRYPSAWEFPYETRSIGTVNKYKELKKLEKPRTGDICEVKKFSWLTMKPKGFYQKVNRKWFKGKTKWVKLP